jgi:hypothetical protein
MKEKGVAVCYAGFVETSKNTGAGGRMTEAVVGGGGKSESRSSSWSLLK